MRTIDARTFCWSRFAWVAAAMGFFGSPALAAGPDQIEAGKELFMRRFVAGPRHPGEGDGLGPLFNHVSCAACHLQGSIGGGGGVEFNVMLLSAQLTGGRRPEQKTLLTVLRSLHPAFGSGENTIVSSILLHRFGPGERYFQLKADLGIPDVPLQPEPTELDQMQRQLAGDPQPTAKTKGPVRLLRTQRNTTALFGAGLIDEIPDSALVDLAEAQALQGQASGRVPPIGPDRVGRFGWRGQQEHLHDFVLGACANELGLEVPGNQQPLNPLHPKYRPKGLDLTNEQCLSLTTYVASLPPPKFVEPKEDEQRAIVSRGRIMFDGVGCAACHVERIGPVQGIFSDLLLHDMGTTLADPVPAAATLVFVRQLSRGDDLLTSSSASIPRNGVPVPVPQPAPPNHYYGSGFDSLSLTGPAPSKVQITDPKTKTVSEYNVQPTSFNQEWRTPP